MPLDSLRIGCGNGEEIGTRSMNGWIFMVHNAGKSTKFHGSYGIGTFGTPTYPWSIAYPKRHPLSAPNVAGIPNHKVLVGGRFGMFQGYVGKFLESWKIHCDPLLAATLDYWSLIANQSLTATTNVYRRYIWANYYNS